MVLLETERLLLRQLAAADVDNLCALDSDPAVMCFLNGGLPTPREVIERDILPRFLAYYGQYEGYGYWAAVEKTSSAFLGWISLHPALGGDPTEATLGYRLRRSAWGKGHATEGARALIDKSFGEIGMRRVTATTYQDNIASRRVMETLGMRLVRFYRPTLAELAATGTFVAAGEVWDGDDVEYALEREEWRRQQAIERAQALVRQYVPEKRSLVDELLAERRQEAGRE